MTWLLPTVLHTTYFSGIFTPASSRFYASREGSNGYGAPRCRANIKVSSTETGAIFGNIVYEATGYAERSVVVLADIHIDIMDYISPAACADVQFRSMWAEFEWENKVR